ncbi:transglutaminase family protein [Frankia sp. R82]|uniref:transglutaminase family protein n=1 Tax=Frankia sp. R82 TaxID=2950553 RepID=UPI0020444412|nr:transglutaminase family protein [Frankia sp. R82]MCM3886678.1 transglutaminase family protein [Frankia sp. R82]
MSWQIRIEHSTGYRYASAVLSSYNEVRIIPQTAAAQLTLEATVRTEPAATTYRYWDYWGTQVTAFDLHTPHTELVVTGRSIVQTASAPVRPTDTPTWDQLASDPVADEFVEYLRPSASTGDDPALVEAARDLAARHSPSEFIPAVGDWVRERLTYRPGTTGVHTAAVEAWQQGEGVCQDFAHLALVLMRAAGMPARYVSGYQHPSASAEVGETVAGQSHAWVEGWIGEWWGFDPTNAVPAGQQHVVVARGRDYNDVPPMRGVYSGGASTSLGVTVNVTRLA